MSYCTVQSLRSILGVGALYTDATLQEVCDAADQVLTPMLASRCAFTWRIDIANNVATAFFDASHPFTSGDAVTLTGCGSIANGAHTITNYGHSYIQFALTHADTVFPLVPWGKVAETVPTTDFTTDTAVVKAAEMIAVDIWQARNSAGAASIGLDGNPMPYRLGVSLLGRVRGLIAHAVDVRGLMG